MTICRELTKKHETAFLTTLQDALEYYRQEDPRGECVIVMEGRSRKEMIEEKQRAWEEMSLEEHMKIYEDQGIGRKDAMKMVAKDRGISKREVYQGLLEKFLRVVARGRPRCENNKGGGGSVQSDFKLSANYDSAHIVQKKAYHSLVYESDCTNKKASA